MSLFRSSARSVRATSAVAEGLSGHSSAALEEMGSLLGTRERTHVLYLGPICDRTIQFFATRGSRVYVEATDDLRFLVPDPAEDRADERPGVTRLGERHPAGAWSRGISRSSTGPGVSRGETAGAKGVDPAATEREEQEKKHLSRLVLAYPDAWFDAILLWDVMDYLPDRMAGIVGKELRRVSRQGALVLVYSDARRKSQPSPVLRFRLTEDRTLETREIPGGPRRRKSRENRDLFRLFPGFEIHRSTLLKTQLREIVLRKSD